MNDLDIGLRKALAIETPVLDEAKLRDGVRVRWARRRRRMAGGMAAVALILSAVWLASAMKRERPQTTTSTATVARRAAHPPRPVFALALPLTPQRAAKAVADEIAKLRALLARTAMDDPARPDILLRLGEAYDEQRRSAIAEGQPAARTTAASAALLQWRAIYDDQRYREYARLDEVLFEAGYLLYEEKRQDEAQAIFQRLLDKHPRSRFAANAALARAESFFENGDMKKALQYYHLVQQQPQSVVYGYASYKVGWAHYNLGENDLALAAFGHVIEAGLQGKLPASNSAEMIKECRKDLVLVYSVAGQRDKAWPFFSRYGNHDEALAMLERLAALYDDQGKPEAAGAVRHEVARLRSAPNQPK